MLKGVSPFTLEAYQSVKNHKKCSAFPEKLRIEPEVFAHHFTLGCHFLGESAGNMPEYFLGLVLEIIKVLNNNAIEHVSIVIHEYVTITVTTVQPFLS
jgi:hypothetical protein